MPPFHHRAGTSFDSTVIFSTGMSKRFQRVVSVFGSKLEAAHVILDEESKTATNVKGSISFEDVCHRNFRDKRNQKKISQISQRHQVRNCRRRKEALTRSISHSVEGSNIHLDSQDQKRPSKVKGEKLTSSSPTKLYCYAISG